MQFNVICLVLSCMIASGIATVCKSDSQCLNGYHCCNGTIWCCRIGTVCTGTSECRLELSESEEKHLSAGVIAGIMIGVLGFVIIISVSVVVAIVVYRKYFQN